MPSARDSPVQGNVTVVLAPAAHPMAGRGDRIQTRRVGPVPPSGF